MAGGGGCEGGCERGQVIEMEGARDDVYYMDIGAGVYDALYRCIS